MEIETVVTKVEESVGAGAWGMGSTVTDGAGLTGLGCSTEERFD